MAVVLPAPLWPSRPSTVPGGHVEVEVAERPEVAEALAEALGDDARVAWCIMSYSYGRSYIVRRT